MDNTFDFQGFPKISRLIRKCKRLSLFNVSRWALFGTEPQKYQLFIHELKIYTILFF